mmetsp:Transcript_44347/g.139055  ORF Transcript_44347/g.139055 Transcript_44347/m.139055 type:complete len:394 (-) Transcript_44347:104-1285(-)
MTLLDRASSKTSDSSRSSKSYQSSKGTELDETSSPSQLLEGATLDLSDSESPTPGNEPSSPSSCRPPRVSSAGRRPPPMRERALRPPKMELRTNSSSDWEDEGSSAASPPHGRPRTHHGMPRPRCLSLSGSFTSLKATNEAALITPGTPLPDRADFREVVGGVTVIFFDFDGTLTATPGDRAARPMKQAELRSRGPMLEPRLHALREAGAVLGIISKSTEATIRDALQAACLSPHFEAPIIGKAMSFDGKAGIIDELVRKGTFPRLGGKGVSPQAMRRRVLLIDDDVLELERARDMGFQTFAAPATGGLQEEDFPPLVRAVRLPPPMRRNVGTAPAVGRHGARRGAPFWAVIPPLSPRYQLRHTLPEFSTSCCKEASGKWRNLILFSGECFEG